VDHHDPWDATTYSTAVQRRASIYLRVSCNWFSGSWSMVLTRT
jgi:hypothetical protein